DNLSSMCTSRSLLFASHGITCIRRFIPPLLSLYTGSSLHVNTNFALLKNVIAVEYIGRTMTGSPDAIVVKLDDLSQTHASISSATFRSLPIIELTLVPSSNLSSGTLACNPSAKLSSILLSVLLPVFPLPTQEKNDL